AEQNQVDAHALAFMEHAGPVVPIREWLALERPWLNVDEPELDERRHCPALGRGDVGGPHECRRVPHVVVSRRDVEVTAYREAGRFRRIRGQRVAQGT